MSRQTPIAIPPGDKDHIIPQVLSLYLGLLEDYDVGLQDIEHGREGPLISPWRMSKRIPEQNEPRQANARRLDEELPYAIDWNTAQRY